MTERPADSDSRPPAGEKRDPYTVKSLVYAVRVMRAFASPQEVLGLAEIARRTGLDKSRCFRLLHTMVRCGIARRAGRNQYRCAARIGQVQKYRVGYCSQESRTSFSTELLEGLQRAAEEAGDIELLVLNNRMSAKQAVLNAEKLVAEKVDLAIEFQTDERAAAVVSARLLDAGIPFIAVDMPHPGATYFGVNNYSAGLTAGHFIGRWVRSHWQPVEEVLLLEQRQAGHVPAMRLDGLLAGFGESYPDGAGCRVTRLDSAGEFATAVEAVRRHLRRNFNRRRVVIGAVNDTSALGALRAFEEAGRLKDCIAVSHNADLDARLEMRRPQTRLAGSVGFFPERYGAGLIRLAADLLARKPVPPSVFITHHLITPANVDKYYPLDSITAAQRR